MESSSDLIPATRPVERLAQLLIFSAAVGCLPYFVLIFLDVGEQAPRIGGATALVALLLSFPATRLIAAVASLASGTVALVIAIISLVFLSTADGEEAILDSTAQVPLVWVLVSASCVGAYFAIRDTLTGVRRALRRSACFVGLAVTADAIWLAFLRYLTD